MKIRTTARAAALVFLACMASWILVGGALADKPPVAHDASVAKDQPASDRIAILFLGDNALHKPVIRYESLMPVLAKQGIDLTYTEDVADLNPENLHHYDGVLIYANHINLPSANEKALVDFVEGGKGLIPVHCASACFVRSRPYIELVGGQFKTHKTGEFQAKIVDSKHPAMKGVEEFESWDETYVHQHLADDMRVLMVRSEGDRLEPWTWVREQGKGRVYYTASGHDLRTWDKPEFQQMLAQGIRWAVGRPDYQLAVKGFDRLPAELPNYLSGDRAGPGRYHDMQAPLSPDESVKHLSLPGGFHSKFFAGEPDIVKPIAMAWDERGRTWIAETVDYPNDKQPDGKGHDRIRICEDTDGDGQADKFTVFADGLSIPTSMVFANGGLIVAQAPEVLFLKDTDGDDRADERKVLFTGFGVFDTHAGPSNFRLGHDGWIYGTVGYSGFEGRVGGETHQFRQGMLRFKPDGSDMEFLTSTSNNTWGLGLSETGELFYSTANAEHSSFVGIPNRAFEGVRGWHAKGNSRIADHAKMHPITKYRQVDVHGGFTAAAGHAIYTARQYPKRFWNSAAFVCEPTGHLVHLCKLEPSGSSYISHDGFNMLASTDEWTAPIVAEVGPDGCVWVVDWYNYIVQHNPTPTGFETGKGNAYVTPLRDKTHARIYRLVYGDSDPGQPMNLAGASPKELVAALAHDNMFWRQTAQRLLIDRGQTDVLPQLAELVGETDLDSIGNSPGAYHALWTMSGLGAFRDASGPWTKVAIQALSHPAAPVRKTAVAVLPRAEESVQAIIDSQLLDDADPQVRRAALLAISEMPETGDAGALIVDMLNKPQNAGDDWIPLAGTAAAARHALSFLKAACQDRKRGSSEDRGDSNLIANGSFEELDASGQTPFGWQSVVEQGQAACQVTEIALSGRHSLMIAAGPSGVAQWQTKVAVKPNTDYLLTGWLRMNMVSDEGAMLIVRELLLDGLSQSVTGTGNWTRVSLEFNSRDHKSLTLGVRLGLFRPTNGMVWLDDLQLREKDNIDVLNAVVPVVAAHYARGGPADSVLDLLASCGQTDPKLVGALLDGLLSGWPDDARPDLNAKSEAGLLELMNELPRDGKIRLASLVERWGAGEKFANIMQALVRELLSDVDNGELSDQERVDAAVQLVRIGLDQDSLDQILENVNPKDSPELATGLLDAVRETNVPQLGVLLVRRWPTFTPSIRQSVVDVLVRRPAWTLALLDGLEQSSVDVNDLGLDYEQQLLRYPDEDIARRAHALLKSQERLPSPDRKLVLDELLPLAGKSGNAEHGRKVFEENCAKCHRHGQLGASIGPDLTGFAVHPKEKILTEVIDPNRSVEGNFRQYTLATKDGLVFSGLLVSETATALQLLDSQAKEHVVLRDDIEDMIASSKTIMPEGFEKQLSHDQIVNLLEFLTAKGQYVSLPLEKAATTVSTRGMLKNKSAEGEMLALEDWSTKTVSDVPFHLIDPRDGRIPNVILLHAAKGTFPKNMPESVRVPCNMSAKTIHLLSGVSGWGYPSGETGSVSMIVRLHYQDGKTEDHPLKNGEHFAEFARRVDVPGSKLAFLLGKQQMRYLTIDPKRDAPIAELEFLAGSDNTAPIVMAVTVEAR